MQTDNGKTGQGIDYSRLKRTFSSHRHFFFTSFASLFSSFFSSLSLPLSFHWIVPFSFPPQLQLGIQTSDSEIDNQTRLFIIPLQFVHSFLLHPSNSSSPPHLQAKDSLPFHFIYQAHWLLPSLPLLFFLLRPLPFSLPPSCLHFPSLFTSLQHTSVASLHSLLLIFPSFYILQHHGARISRTRR